MRDTHLHMVAEKHSGPLSEIVAETMEKHRVHIVDIGLSIHRITHAHALVPVFLACLTDILQRIERVD